MNDPQIGDIVKIIWHGAMDDEDIVILEREGDYSHSFIVRVILAGPGNSCDVYNFNFESSPRPWELINK